MKTVNKLISELTQQRDLLNKRIEYLRTWESDGQDVEVIMSDDLKSKDPKRTICNTIVAYLQKNGPSTSGEILVHLAVNGYKNANSVRAELSSHTNLFARTADYRWYLVGYMNPKVIAPAKIGRPLGSKMPATIKKIEAIKKFIEKRGLSIVSVLANSIKCDYKSTRNLLARNPDIFAKTDINTWTLAK